MIFEPYYTTKEEGTGLGLALSKRIVEEHQGVLSVESTLGTGSLFTIRVPARIPQPQPA
jgi:signal transduction histidine kinase